MNQASVRDINQDILLKSIKLASETPIKVSYLHQLRHFQRHQSRYPTYINQFSVRDIEQGTSFTEIKLVLETSINAPYL